MNPDDGNLPPADLARVAELAEKQRDGVIADAEVAELEALLAESAEARVTFVTLALLTTELEQVQDRFVATHEPAPRRTWRPGAFARRWWPLAAAAGIAATAVLGWRVAQPAAAPGRVIATISHTNRAVLLAAGRPAAGTVGAELRVGPHELKAGLLEFTYPNGVVILIEAPAQFELRTGAALGLPRGKASARVPAAARGFTVETPSGSIVDLGTAFGVTADAQSSEVHVFEGEVLVRDSDKPDPLHLAESRASRIDTQTRTPTGIDFRPEGFWRSLDEPVTPLSELVRSWSPVGYYRMRIGPDALHLADDSGENHNGRIIPGANQRVSVPGLLGAGLPISGPRGGGFAVVPDFPKAPADGLTVIAWVRADSRPRWASIVKNWAKDRGANYGGQFHFGLWRDEGSLEVHVHDAEGREVGVQETQPLPLREWQFVAFTFDGTTLRLYRNGREVAATSCRGLSQIAPSALAIGVKLDLNGTAPEATTPGFWDGTIDELGIFHRALGPEEIRALFAAAP